MIPSAVQIHASDVATEYDRRGERAMTSALLSLLLLAVAAPALAQSAPLPAERVVSPETHAPAAAPATLTVWNHPIVVFRASVRKVHPVERAAKAAQRIEAIPADVRPEEIAAQAATVGDLRGVWVLAGNQILFGITPDDLDPGTGETLESVSARAVDQIRAVLRARADQRRWPVLLRGIALSIVATALLLAVLWLDRRAADRAQDRATRAVRPRAARLLGLDLWPFVHAAQRTMVALTAWGLGLVAVYLWLTFVLQQFPYTRPWGALLGGYVVDLLRELATGALHALPGLFAVVVIFLATRFIVRLVDALFRGIEQGTVTVGGFPPDTAGATRRITTVLIWIFALTVAYRYIPGSESDAFKAVGVFAGLMISLGSAGLVNQVMSGLVMIYARALRPGELVRAGEVVGIVTEVNLLSTKVVTVRREQVTIPNAVLAGTMITNYSRLADQDGAIVATAVTIGYDAPWRQVHALLLLAAERTPGLRREPRPSVLQKALSDFYVEYELRAHLDRAEGRFQVLSDLHAQIQDAFNEFGVQIMSPHFEGQPDRPVIAPPSAWHTPPAPGAAASDRRAGPAPKLNVRGRLDEKGE
jgi:small-conductance mechanosensitive channel